MAAARRTPADPERMRPTLRAAARSATQPAAPRAGTTRLTVRGMPALSILTVWGILVVLAAPCAAAGQAGRVPADPSGSSAPAASARSMLHDPSGHPFRSLAGSPLEPVHRLSLVHVSRDGRDGPTAFGDLGDRIPFWIRRSGGGGLELAGQLAAAAFSRFDLEESENEFIEIHYRVGFALRARYGRVAARAEFYHVSSHLGDEFLRRTGTEPSSSSREAVELLLQAELSSGVMVYGGPGWVVRSTLPFDRASVRGGFELESAPGRAGLYAAGEAFLWDELDGALLSLEAGWALSPHARLGLTVGGGRSRAEQFFREDETLWGMTFSFRR